MALITQKGRLFPLASFEIVIVGLFPVLARKFGIALHSF